MPKNKVTTVTKYYEKIHVSCITCGALLTFNSDRERLLKMKLHRKANGCATPVNTTNVRHTLRMDATPRIESKGPGRMAVINYEDPFPNSRELARGNK